jgi:NarL family two-component system response regulator LiaR
MYVYIARRRRKIRFPGEHKFYLPSDAGIFLRAYIGCMADIRVLIVDDMEEVRQDLRTFLTLAGDLEIVGEASNGLEGVRLAEALQPQVVLMDLEMPVMDGYAATRQLKACQPSCRVIVLTIHTSQAEQNRAVSAGADSFIGKGASLDTLMESIRKVPSPGITPKGEKS